LEALGIDAAENKGDLKFSEEGTLWHEVSHSFLDYINGRSHREEDEKIDSADVWLTTPGEIAAINYGNIPHIKNKIKEYFTKIYPFPDRITAGLLEQIKSDVVQTFALEFYGYPKGKAYQLLYEAMPQFDADSLEIINSLSKEEQIEKLTDMFSEYFIRRFMRIKVEDAIEAEMKEVMGLEYGKASEVRFREEPIVPEPYKFVPQSGRDPFIKQLEKREDYKQFFEKCREALNKDYQTLPHDQYMNKYRRYVHTFNPTNLITPTTIEDLLIFLFEPPAHILSVDTKNINQTFSNLIPQSLMNDVINMVEKEKTLKSGYVYPKPTKKIVSPDEAEEAGKFMSEMHEEYGPDWIWVAKVNNWYKQAKNSNYKI
jgi:hypothetical protein